MQPATWATSLTDDLGLRYRTRIRAALGLREGVGKHAARLKTVVNVEGLRHEWHSFQLVEVTRIPGSVFDSDLEVQ